MSRWLRRNAVGVVLAAIAAGLVTWMFARAPARAPASHVPVARARFSACMLGESASHAYPDDNRLRAIQLAGAADWPKRCAPFAEALEHALSHDDYTHDNDASHTLYGGGLFHRTVEGLLKADEDEPIVPIEDVARDVPRPPPPAVFPAEVPVVAWNASPLLALGDPDLALILGERLACRFAAHAGGLEPTAHCTHHADAIEFQSRSSLASTTKADDLAVVTDDGVRAFATGERLVATPAARQASNVAGTLYVWPADATRTSVLRRAPDGATTILRLPHKLDDSATLVRDQLLWTEKDRVAGVSLAGDKLGAVYEVAKAAHLPVPVTCAGDQVAGALVVVGEDQYRVAAFANGAWRLGDVGPRYALTCSGDTVTGIATDSRSTGLEIDRVDCNATGCTAAKAMLEHVAELNAVAAIGKDTIVVWVDDVVRGVSAPLSQLATAPRFIVFDGFSDKHITMTETEQRLSGPLVQGLEVVGRGASAIVVLHGDGIHLVHVRDGKPERVNVVLD